MAEREASSEERTAAAILSRRLSGFPLALTQMAAVIRQTGVTCSELVSKFEALDTRTARLRIGSGILEIHSPRDSSSNPQRLAEVWSFDYLNHGRALLNVLSMFDPDGVSDQLLSRGMAEVSMPGYPQSFEELALARKELTKRSLVSWSKRDKKLTIHRLVQDVARTRLSNTELCQTFITCTILIYAAWPFDPFDWRHSIRLWSICEELFPHVSRLKDILPFIPRTDRDLWDDYQFVRLLTAVGWYLHERGRHVQSSIFHNTARDLCQSLSFRLDESLSFPREQSRTSKLSREILDATLAELHHNSGCIANETNEPHDAIIYLQKFHRMMQRELGGVNGGSDMRLAISWNQLGNARMLNEDWDAGEECFRESIKVMEQLENYKPTMISLPLVNLGLALWLKGKNSEAMQVLLEGLAHREAEFGEDDRISFITGRYFHALGNLFHSLSDLTSSYHYHQKALLHYRSTLGLNHHRTADTFVKVAQHYIHSLGQYGTARALLDHALHAYTTYSDSYEPEQARVLYLRSLALRALGKIEDADRELQHAWKQYRHIYNRRRICCPDRYAEGCKEKMEDLQEIDFERMISFWSK